MLSRLSLSPRGFERFSLSPRGFERSAFRGGVGRLDWFVGYRKAEGWRIGACCSHVVTASECAIASSMPVDSATACMRRSSAACDGGDPSKPGVSAVARARSAGILRGEAEGAGQKRAEGSRGQRAEDAGSSRSVLRRATAAHGDVHGRAPACEACRPCCLS